MLPQKITENVLLRLKALCSRGVYSNVKGDQRLPRLSSILLAGLAMSTQEILL